MNTIKGSSALQEGGRLAHTSNTHTYLTTHRNTQISFKDLNVCVWSGSYVHTMIFMIYNDTHNSELADL